MDANSEQYRHACEVRAILAMPSDRRRGYLELVGKRRGAAAGQQLRNDVYQAWVEGQVDVLVKMQRDDDRMARLLKIQNSSNARTRADVEAAMGRRLAANDNNEGNV